MKKRRLVTVVFLLASLLTGGIAVAYVIHINNQPQTRIKRRIRSALKNHQYREALNWYYAGWRRNEKPVHMFGLSSDLEAKFTSRADINAAIHALRTDSHKESVGPIVEQLLWPRLPASPEYASQLSVSLGNFSQKWQSIDPDLQAVLSRDSPQPTEESDRYGLEQDFREVGDALSDSATDADQALIALEMLTLAPLRKEEASSAAACTTALSKILLSNKEGDLVDGFLLLSGSYKYSLLPTFGPQEIKITDRASETILSGRSEWFQSVLRSQGYGPLRDAALKKLLSDPFKNDTVANVVLLCLVNDKNDWHSAIEIVNRAKDDVMKHAGPDRIAVLGGVSGLHLSAVQLLFAANHDNRDDEISDWLMKNAYSDVTAAIRNHQIDNIPGDVVPPLSFDVFSFGDSDKSVQADLAKIFRDPAKGRSNKWWYRGGWSISNAGWSHDYCFRVPDAFIVLVGRTVRKNVAYVKHPSGEHVQVPYEALTADAAIVRSKDFAVLWAGNLTPRFSPIAPVLSGGTYHATDGGHPDSSKFLDAVRRLSGKVSGYAGRYNADWTGASTPPGPYELPAGKLEKVHKGTWDISIDSGGAVIGTEFDKTAGLKTNLKGHINEDGNIELTFKYGDVENRIIGVLEKKQNDLTGTLQQYCGNGRQDRLCSTVTINLRRR